MRARRVDALRDAAERLEEHVEAGVLVVAEGAARLERIAVRLGVAAELLGLAAETVRRLPDLPSVRAGRRARLFLVRDLVGWAERHREEPGPRRPRGPR